MPSDHLSEIVLSISIHKMQPSLRIEFHFGKLDDSRMFQLAKQFDLTDGTGAYSSLISKAFETLDRKFLIIFFCLEDHAIGTFADLPKSFVILEGHTLQFLPFYHL